MSAGKYEGLKAFGSVLAGLGGLAALITVAVNVWQEKPANVPVAPPQSEVGGSAEPSTPTRTSNIPEDQPDVIGRSRFFGTWSGGFALERYQITFHEDGTYDQRTQYVVSKRVVHTSGAWTFDAPHFSISVSSSTSSIFKPVGSIVYGEVLKSSQNSLVIRTQLISSMTLVKH